MENTSFATVYGAPGIRVRILGIAAIYWPLLVVLFLCGFLLSSALAASMNPGIALLSIVALLAFSWLRISRLDARFDHYVKGAHGEELVARELSCLPADWTVFHGVPRINGLHDLRGGGSDYDHIVLGPGTLFVIETKNWAGPVSVEGGVVHIGGRPVKKSPIGQVRREAAALARTLGKALPPNLPIVNIICFASNGLTPDTVLVDSTPLCNLRVLQKLLLSSPATSISATERSEIVNALLSQG